VLRTGVLGVFLDAARLICQLRYRPAGHPHYGPVTPDPNT
jgi:hypothetical protein